MANANPSSKRSASVQLVGAESYAGRGRKFKKGESKIISNADEILYFKNQPTFKVTFLSPAPAASAPAKAKAPTPPPPPPAPTSKDGEGDGDGEDESEYLPWSKSMKKADLLAAAADRDIAVTPDDTNPDIVQMLREFDEDAGE